MRTISEILTALGGYAAVADHVGLPYPTVAAWGQRQSIPVHYWPDLLLVAQDKGVDLTLGKLVRAHCHGRKSVLGTEAPATANGIHN